MAMTLVLVGPRAVESSPPWHPITPTGGLFVKSSAPVCFIAALDRTCILQLPSAAQSASSPRLRLQPLFDGAAACIGMGDLLDTPYQSCALTGRPSISGMHGLHLLPMVALVQ